MINAQNRMDSIHKLIIVTGFIALLLSIVMGAQFYSSLAHSTVGVVTYVTAGALLTCLVVLSLSIALYAFQKGFVIMGTMLTILWMVLISLEILAEFGFLATQQERRAMEVAKDSTQARLAEESVKTAAGRVENLTQYSTVDITAVQGELDSLQAELDGAQARLAGCPANFKTKCINPARSDIVRIQKQMEPLEAQAQGYQAYQSAVNGKAAASKELGAALSGKDIGLAMSPAYTWLARLTGITAENIQAGTSFLIAFLLSIWASFAGFILLRIKGETAAAVAGGGSGYQVSVQAPADTMEKELDNRLLSHDELDAKVAAIVEKRLAAASPKS